MEKSKNSTVSGHHCGVPELKKQRHSPPSVGSAASGIANT
jgi:hypothetical protein